MSELPAMHGALWALLRRDLTLMMRQRAEAINPLWFYGLILTLFTLGVGAEPGLLAAIGPGVIWVSALLSTLLSLEGVFKTDFSDGSLEQLVLSPQPLWLLVLVKTLVHWLISGLPLLLIAPLLSELMQIPAQARGVLWLSLLLGTPVLSALGGVGVALTLGLRRGGIILGLLVLPLYVPVLIFAVTAVHAATQGLSVDAHLSIMAALLALALSLTPLATAAALKVSLS